MGSDICIGQNCFGANFTPNIYDLFFGKIYAQWTQMPLKFKTIGRYSGFRFKDFLEIRLFESKLYEMLLSPFNLQE